MSQTHSKYAFIVSLIRANRFAIRHNNGAVEGLNLGGFVKLDQDHFNTDFNGNLESTASSYSSDIQMWVYRALTETSGKLMRTLRRSNDYSGGAAAISDNDCLNRTIGRPMIYDNRHLSGWCSPAS